MVIVHLSACDGQLYLWGETPAGEPAKAAAVVSGAGTVQVSPYDVSTEVLADVFGEGTGGMAVPEPAPLVAWVPTCAGEPMPSDPMIADVPAEGEDIAIAAWWVTAMPVPAEAAVVLLSRCMGRTMLAPGMLLGRDVDYWGAVLRFAGALVGREQVLPGLVERDGSYRACWEPVFVGEEAGRLLRIAGAMPHVARALTLVVGEVPVGVPVEVLTGVLAEWVDHLVRRAVAGQGGGPGRRPGSFASLHDQWLYALRTPAGTMEASRKELEGLGEQIQAWRGPIKVATAAPFRLCFRLEEPEPIGEDGPGVPAASGPWTVRFLLQAVDDPSLLVEVADAWEPDARTAAVFAKRGFAVREYLLVALGQAASLYPRIVESLKRPAPWGFTVDTAEAFAFLTEAAWVLQQTGYGVLLPAWWARGGPRRRLAAQASVRSPAMQASAGLSLDTIVEFDWSLALGDVRLTREEVEALAELKVPLVRVRGQWVQVDAEQIQTALDHWREAGEATVREVVRMALGMAEAPGGLPFEGVEATGWVGALLEQLEEGAAVEPLEAPEGFAGTLRPYQERGYAWLAFLRRWGFGACLADDMGLGKTPQTLALLQRMWEANGQRPTLVVCPTSVMGNWRKEASRFTPGLPVLLHHGGRRSKKAGAFDNEVQEQALVITSYALLHRDAELLKRVHWSAVVLDEAQNIKNPATKQAQAARSLRADHRVALTGTPVENNVGELWSIMEFLNPGWLGTQAAFRRRFFVPIQTEGDVGAAERLKRLTGPFVLRRLKTDTSIIDDLPEKLEMKVYTTLTKEQASLYRAVVKELTEGLQGSEGIERKGLVLATLMKLKQICNHPAQFLHDGSGIAGRSGKLARLTEMMEEVMEAGDRALIFTQFTEMGELIRRHLQEQFGREVLFLHGGVSQGQRERMVERFQGAEGPPAFLLSLKAGGTGLNLTRANHVFHFDRWWNPAVENQATDRAFRIGQTQRVQVHKFVCMGTVEERIDAMIERKQAVAEQVVGTGEAWITELSTRELKRLFVLGKEGVEG